MLVPAACSFQIFIEFSFHLKSVLKFRDFEPVRFSTFLMLKLAFLIDQLK